MKGMIEGYTLKKKIREGKIAVVYKAFQESLKRFVDIKIFNPEIMCFEQSQKEFRKVKNVFRRRLKPLDG